MAGGFCHNLLITFCLSQNRIKLDRGYQNIKITNKQYVLLTLWMVRTTFDKSRSFVAFYATVAFFGGSFVAFFATFAFFATILFFTNDASCLLPITVSTCCITRSPLITPRGPFTIRCKETIGCLGFSK